MKKELFQNLLVVVISVGGASVCGFLLYRDLYLQKASVDGHLPAGRLAAKHQTVKRKLGDNLIWDLINNEETLYWNDAIQTAEKSGASIVLDNGSRITLGESSLVVLEKDNDQLNLDLKSGQVILASNEVSGSQAIKINGAVVQQMAGQQMAIQMDTSKHMVTATTMAADGSSKQTTVDDKGHVEEKIIPVTLTAPAGLSHLSSEELLTKVAFKWQSPSKQKKVLQVSGDGEFKNILIEKEMAVDNFEANLAPGIYFWRVKVVDTSGQKTMSSETRSFDVVRATPPPENSLIGPGHVVFTTEVPILEFRWAADGGVTKYILEISDSPHFKNTALKVETTDNSFRTTELKPGHFFWRVSSIFGEVVKPSSAKIFDLDRQAVAPPTDLSPEKDFKVSYEYFEKFKGIPFRWKMELVRPIVSRFRSGPIFATRSSVLKPLKKKLWLKIISRPASITGALGPATLRASGPITMFGKWKSVCWSLRPKCRLLTAPLKRATSTFLKIHASNGHGKKSAAQRNIILNLNAWMKAKLKSL